MSQTEDTPKFTVINRRKLMEDEASDAVATAAPAAEEKQTEAMRVPDKPVEETRAAQDAPGPRLVEMSERGPAAEPVAESAAQEELDRLPSGPTTEESSFQKAQYDQSAERLETLVRAQNPGAPAMEKIGFEHLVQQLYLSALMQMGAGTPEGQRPRVDILGARQTIDLMGVLQERTVGNLSELEQRTLETALYELRMTFLELTRMISMQTPPGGAKH